MFWPGVLFAMSAYAWVKRPFESVVAGCTLLLTSPLMLLGAVAVKLSSKGPVFYRAKRAGMGGRPFEMLKLRTMRLGSDGSDRRVTEADDARITPVGHLLRTCKIDELPQLWNVLKGDMSIVGPRPEDWEIVERYFTPEQRRLFDVRPGIASPVDVDWYPDLTYHDPLPADVPMQEHYVRRHLPLQVAGALRYIDRQSLLVDLEVMVRLIYCVLVYSWRPPEKRPLPLES
jgi:lipopolysaccharide/colanic/teichoic acid biosynthesis glycosyltransferase